MSDSVQLPTSKPLPIPSAEQFSSRLEKNEREKMKALRGSVMDDSNQAIFVGNVGTNINLCSSETEKAAEFFSNETTRLTSSTEFLYGKSPSGEEVAKGVNITILKNLKDAAQEAEKKDS